MSIKILIADDEIKANKVVQKSYKEQITSTDIIDFAGDGKEALRIIETNKSSLDLILVDLKMSPMGGIELIDLLSAKQLPIKIIAVSAYVSPDEIENNLNGNQNVLGFLEKPFDINKLNKIIQQNFSLDLPNQAFDYSQFDPDTSVFVREQTEEIRGLMRRTAQGILDIGQKLLDIKEKLGHGNFLNWLKTEFNWSEPTAQRFMQVARQFKSINLMNLEIAPSALYILSAPSTPDSVREEAISRAKAGESITYSSAKQIKQEHQSNKVNKSKTSDRTRQNSILDKSQSETTEASPKPEIVAIIHQPITDRAKTVVRSDVWYRLGQHLLYCGEPNSIQFRRKLPPKASLNIAFPPTSDWRLTTPVEANSELVLFSRYKDVDLTAFKEMIQRALELYTEEKEPIVFSYLPEPELLILADRLGCLCFIAEPDVKKCGAIIDMWQKSRFFATALE